jgi:serine protease Do
MLAMLVALCTATTAAAQSRAVPIPAAQDPLVRMNEAVADLANKVWPSVVQILVSGFGARDEEAPGDAANVVLGPQQSTGSGFVIDAEGYIMTNAHVVNNARRIQVVVPGENFDGRLAAALTPHPRITSARIIGISTELDLAVLKIDGIKVKALPLATYGELRQGETVFAFGSPGGLRNTLTHGMVSAVARQTDPDSPQIFIQTDAPINPGNSGGPLVNVRGEVVGVNTFIMSQSGGNEGLGFAIPSATARTVFRQLKEFGQVRRQDVGMSMQTIRPGMANARGHAQDHGVIVSDVVPRGPADAAGVKIGDILLSVDGQPAENVPTVSYFFRLRDSAEQVQIVVLRGTTEQTIRVAAVEEKSEFDRVSAMADPQQNLVPELGILGVEIDARIAEVAKALRDPYGIVVVARTAGATIDVPLLPRDVIRSVNSRPVFTLVSLRELMRSIKPGSSVTLQIQRENRLMYVSFSLD